MTRFTTPPAFSELIKRRHPVLIRPEIKKLLHTQPDDVADWTLATCDVDIEWLEANCTEGLPVSARLSPSYEIDSADDDDVVLADLMLSAQCQNSKGLEWSVRCPLQYSHLSQQEFDSDPNLAQALQAGNLNPSAIDHSPVWLNGLPAQEIDITSETSIGQHGYNNLAATIAKYRSTIKVSSWDPNLAPADQRASVSFHAFMADSKITRLQGSAIIALTLHPVRQTDPQSPYDGQSSTYADYPHTINGSTTLWKLSSTNTGRDSKTSPDELSSRVTTEIGILRNGLTGGQGKEDENGNPEHRKDWHEYDQFYRAEDGSVYQIQRATLTTIGARVNRPARGRLSVMYRRVEDREFGAGGLGAMESSDKGNRMEDPPFLRLPTELSM